jgi:hypothetical protein
MSTQVKSEVRPKYAWREYCYKKTLKPTEVRRVQTFLAAKKDNEELKAIFITL